MKDVRSLKSLTFPVSLNATRAHISLAVAYVVLIFLLPASGQTFQAYHLTGVAYRVALFMVTLPLFAAWFAAFYGYVTLRAYAKSINDTKSPEGRDFERLANGYGWLAWSLPLPAFVGLIFDAISNARPGFHSAEVIMLNYLNLLMLLIAFSIIGTAARGLISRVRGRFTIGGTRIGLLLLVIGSVFYFYLSFQHLHSASLGSSDNLYFLPVWLWLLTVVIPYLYTWYIGGLAAYEIDIFSRHVHGLVYRQPLRLLVGGLIVVIVSFIALQYVSSVTPRTGHLLLNYRLLLVSGFRIMAGAGYILIALGAIRLKRIEEV